MTPPRIRRAILARTWRTLSALGASIAIVSAGLGLLGMTM
jgi:hypothetical protein